MKIRDYLPPWFGNMKWPLLIVAVTFFLGLLGYLIILFGGKFVVDEKDLILNATTTIVTEDGEILEKVYEENRSLVTIEQIPDHVENAFIAIEDNRFYEHAGVDFKSVMRAVYRDIIAGAKVEGGSTITQQLAKNLFLKNDKTWMRKTKEVMAAIHLERNYSKKKILEFYLNEIYFAHGIYGIGNAAQFFFSKPVEELTISEGAMLAAMAKAPNTYSPLINPDKSKQRRNLVLAQMNELDLLKTEKMVKMQGNALGIEQQEEPSEKPWMDSYINLVIKEAAEKYQISAAELRRGGYKIVVAVDKQAQRIAYEKFQNDEYFHGSTDGVEGTFVLMEQKTGKLVAAIGGRQYEAGDLNRVTVARQPGSTMKPIAVYGPALMQDDYYPYSVIPDKKQSYGDYTVTNISGNYAGSVTIFEALEDSKNAPAVWLLDQIEISYSKDYLKKMDINIDDKGLSIALGGLKKGLTPIELVESYRTFIHEGKKIDSYTIARIYDRKGEMIHQADPETKEVFEPQVAWDMTRMLENVVENGTGQAGNFDKALAGKTGSTQHPSAKGEVKDAWFTGFTPTYVSALWMGYDKSDENHFLTEGSKAPTIMTKDILSELDKQKELQAEFKKPENVEDLPDPIDLPVIDDLDADYTLGGWTLVRGQLTWTPVEDDRVIYRVYKETEQGDEKIGEVKGKGEFTLERVNIFSSGTYYVVPYDPLTKQEGKASNRVELSL